MMIKQFFIFCILAISCSGKKVTSYFSKKFVPFIPDSVLNNQSLKTLYLNPSWTAVTPLGQIISETSTMLKAIPLNLCNLKKLEVLDLSFNQVDTLPLCFYELQNLRELNFSFNTNLKLNSVLSQIPRMKKLKILNLYGVNSALADTNFTKKQVESLGIKLILTDYDLNLITDKMKERSY